MQNRTVEIEVEGMVPYLMHRFATEEADVKATRKSGRKDYEEEVGKALYVDKNGSIYVPAAQLEGCLIKASTDFQIPGKGKKTYKDLCNSALIISPDKIRIDPQEWETDARAVKVQRARVIRYRPRWDEWKLNFRIDILDEQFPTEILYEILKTAGMYKGIGDYRPKYGRFAVTRFEEARDEE